MNSAEYVLLNQRISALEARMDERNKTLQIAIDKAENALERRLFGMNEFREALKDQTVRMVTRSEFDPIKDLVVRNDTKIIMYSIIISGGMSLVVGLILMLLNK